MMIFLPKILLNDHLIIFIENDIESPEKIYFNFLKIKKRMKYLFLIILFNNKSNNYK